MREMDVASVSVGRESSRLLDEFSTQNFRFQKEQHSNGQTLPDDSMTDWSSDQNERRASPLETLKAAYRFEHSGRTMRQAEQQHQPATTMSIQFGTQQHQHHHSHLHYYAPAEVQMRNEASSEELNYYRSYSDQYYSNQQYVQPTNSFRYQSMSQTTNHDSSYSVPVPEQSASSNDYQSGTIYSQKSGPYCQQQRIYQPHGATSCPIAQESSLNYHQYPNHLHQPHQNYGSHIQTNTSDSLHNQSRSQTTMDIELANNNNNGHNRPIEHYAHYDGLSSTGYRDYYARQYNSTNSSSYQYPRQEQYMQMISQNHPTTPDQYHNEQRQQPSSRPREPNLNTTESSSGGVILLTKPKKEATPLSKKRVRESSTRRQATLENQMKTGLPHSLRSSRLPGDSKQSSKTNQCHICNRHYARPSTLKTHLRTHTNERPYKCTVCCKTFSQAANLTAHQRVHTGERPFPCPICGRQFSQSSSVITHLRTHSGERPYRCNMCHRTFSDSSTLTKHCRIHSGEKPYQCEYCQLNFSQSGNLSRHIRLHLLNGLRNPMRVSTLAGDTLLQAREATTATISPSKVSIPASFFSSSSNSSSTESF